MTASALHLNYKTLISDIGKVNSGNKDYSDFTTTITVSRNSMKQFRVLIPDEKYRIIEFIQEGLPGVGVINSALKDFEPKEVFSWHLSILIDFEDLIDNGMPSTAEREIVDTFGEQLDTLIKGANSEKPNALFLARITWNKTRELIWRVYEPEAINKELQNIIKNKSSPRGFDYRMEEDNEWKLAQWHLNNC